MESSTVFSMGFRKGASGRMTAFTEPEPWPEALTALRLLAPNVRLNGCREFRIVCDQEGQTHRVGQFSVTKPPTLFHKWVPKLTEIAEAGAEALVKSIRLQEHIPVEEIVEEWLNSLPVGEIALPNHVLLLPVPARAHDVLNSRRMKPRTVQTPEGPRLGLQAFPHRLVPFATTANRLMLQRAKLCLQVYFEGMCEHFGDSHV